MSDNMKPDLGHCGSDGEDDGNTCHSFDQYSMEEIQMCLECLVLFAATAGFLAFQLVTNAIFEEEYERDVAWIAKQSRSMSSIDDEDDYMEDMEFEDSEDEDQEELQDQMEEAEEDEAEDEMHLEAGAAISLDDLTACTFVPDYKLQKNEFKCKLLYVCGEPTLLVSVPVESEEPTENAEEASGEKEEDETEELEGESTKNLDSEEGSLF
ncbi:tumor rejection antigen P815A isoform X2 [Cricetulus griseus]|uniref:Tumor rejection antigen P815A isoform X2 n=2 Tax=Cricetulus griseus TaxID=10029 RepID=A0A9J7K213_CRIGR|nr:tumor rejection antigen P815A isoform X2 [Cricetulus griseus]